jgi:hypothetical protein
MSLSHGAISASAYGNEPGHSTSVGQTRSARDSLIVKIGTARAKLLLETVAPILFEDPATLISLSSSALPALRQSVGWAVMDLPEDRQADVFPRLAAALGVELPAVTPPSSEVSLAVPQRPGKRPRSALLATLFTAVTVVSVVLAQRFATASAFIEVSSPEASSPEVLAFARMAHKVPHDALQEGSYIVAMAHDLDEDEQPDAAAFVSSVLLVFRVLARPSGPSGPLTIKLVALVGETDSGVTGRTALFNELGIKIGDEVSLPPQSAYLVASSEFLVRLAIGGDERLPRRRLRVAENRVNGEALGAEDDDEDGEDLLARLGLGVQHVPGVGVVSSRWLQNQAGGGPTSGKDKDERQIVLFDEIDGSREILMGAVPKDKRNLAILLFRALRRAMEKLRCAALIQDCHVRYDPLAVGIYVYNHATALAEMPVEGAVPLPTHRIWHSAGVLRDFPFLDVAHHRSPALPSSYSMGELAYLLSFGPSSRGRLSVVAFLANAPGLDQLSLVHLREAVRLSVTFLSGYLGVSYVVVGNKWSELLSDPSGTLSRLPTRYLFYLVDTIMGSWFDQLSQITSAEIKATYQIDVALPEGARELLLRLITQSFRPSHEGALTSMHLWAPPAGAQTGASTTPLAPQALLFSPSPAAAAAPAPSVHYAASRNGPAFTVAVSAPPRAAPASLPASLPTQGAGQHSMAVCWQFVGFVIGARDKKKGSPYECLKAECPHHHIDPSAFHALPKSEKLKRFDEWKVPAPMKADFVKALH